MPADLYAARDFGSCAIVIGPAGVAAIFLRGAHPDDEGAAKAEAARLNKATARLHTAAGDRQ